MSCTVLLTHDRRPIFPMFNFMFNLKFNMMLYRIFTFQRRSHITVV
jgi:hypothetical protein